MKRLAAALVLIASLAACSSSVELPPDPPRSSAPAPQPPVGAAPPVPAVAAGSVIQREASRWLAVDWQALPSFGADELQDAWAAWTRSCERPAPMWAAICREIRSQMIASDAERRVWLQARLQPYRVEALSGTSDGLLTGYFEPALEASRRPQGGFQVPLYRAPIDLARRKPWFTRQQIESDPAVMAQLRGTEIAYVEDPIEALSLQIQGTGRLNVREPDGSVRSVRVAFAGTNDQAYQSVGKWLIEQGLIREASWQSIKAWARANPQRLNEMMWRNPRYVFFREEPLEATGGGVTGAGPRGAQGVALTAGRSIAVDPRSIPYGTPVWLSTTGPTLTTNRLMLAQDTGSAITGAVRADYYVGSGAAAGELAGRLKQPMAMWVLWPK